MDAHGLCVGRDAALAPQVCSEDARPPPVLQREAEPPSQFGFGLLDSRESLGLLTEGRPRELPIPPDSERHPVVVDLHEHACARLTLAACEMLEDRQAGRRAIPPALLRKPRAPPIQPKVP